MCDKPLIYPTQCGYQSDKQLSSKISVKSLIYPIHVYKKKL